MTISLAWVRRNKSATELILASDSRLRARGAINQCQKIVRLERGDCALSFCGEAQVAYPLFTQIGPTIDNFIKTRSRAEDVTNLTHLVSVILNSFIASWDLSPEEKAEELATTRVILSGWSWKLQRFHLGMFSYNGQEFEFHRFRARLPHPWREKARSLMFAGDYADAYFEELASVLGRRHGMPATQEEKRKVDFDYEPIEALNALLKRAAGHRELSAIGGAPQMLKLYPFSQSLPVVIRTDPDAHFLFGRKLLPWEKTEYPVLDLVGDEPAFLYPMSEIPLPGALTHPDAGEPDTPCILPPDSQDADA